VTKSGAKSLEALLKAVAEAGSLTGGSTVQIGSKGKSKEAKEVLDSSRLPVTRFVASNTPRLLQAKEQYEGLVSAHDALNASAQKASRRENRVRKSFDSSASRAGSSRSFEDFELPAECASYVCLVWGQLQANLRLRQQSFRDLSLGLVFAINNLWLVVSLLDEQADLRQVMGLGAQEVKDALDDNCDKLIQRCWLAPLQVLCPSRLLSLALERVGAPVSPSLLSVSRLLPCPRSL
jgi:hypothetical protein